MNYCIYFTTLKIHQYKLQLDPDYLTVFQYTIVHTIHKGKYANKVLLWDTQIEKLHLS